MSDGPIGRLKELQREIQYLGHTLAVLDWDQETYMPKRAIGERSEQRSLLEGLIHDRATAGEIGELLAALGATDKAPSGDKSLSPVDGALVRETFRDFSRRTRLPKDLVTALARETSLAQARWVEARKKDDFSLFQPNLDRVLGLTLEKAEAWGYREHPYDALLDDFEPWMTTAEVTSIFGRLESDLRLLLAKIVASDRTITTLEGHFPVDRQRVFGEKLIRDLNFDIDRGRLDVSAHPFSTTLGSDDMRLTTRYDASYLPMSVFGTIHECGHGLYEQGARGQLDGTVLAGGTSLAIHESQSRFWENVIGRSHAFWRHYYSELKGMFPESLGTVDLDTFYRSVNRVAPSFIRVEADEVTYSLHVILRFNLEKLLLTRELATADLPEAWREQSRLLLGLAPEKEADGVLQDIHWSMGAIGYFPTYALGNLYAAQFHATMKAELTDLESLVERGEFSTILDWLRDRVHRHGKVFPAGELCERVTGSRLDPSHYVDYLNEKFASIYGL